MCRNITNAFSQRFYIHQIERVLTLHCSDDANLTDGEYGAVIYFVHELRKRSKFHVPYKEAQTFYEDLSDLESDNLNCNQKKEVINRMYRTHKFIHGTNKN